MPTPTDDSTFLDRATARRRGIPLEVLLGHQYTKLFFDCYVRSTVTITPALLVRAAMYCWPNALGASHHSAAQLWGGVVPRSSDVHLAVESGCRTKRKGIKTHRHSERPTMGRQSGIPLTSPAQTFVDLAGGLDLVDLVILGDSLIKKNRVTIEELRRSVAVAGGRGHNTARRASTLVRAAVDSPNETRLRLLIVLAGLPEPTVNVTLRDLDGEIRRRLDLAYEKWKVAIEFDGRQHIEREPQWERDLLRREELEAQGWRFVVITATDIYTKPEQALARVAAAMRIQGMVVPRMHERWRNYFAPGSSSRAA